MWKVDPSFDLPEGFSLQEDEDFVYLLYYGQKVRIFNIRTATPKIILQACKELEDSL